MCGQPEKQRFEFPYNVNIGGKAVSRKVVVWAHTYAEAEVTAHDEIMRRWDEGDDR